MIVRILTEGQYRLDSQYLDRMNEIDNRLVEVVAGADEQSYKDLVSELISLVREQGVPVPASELVASDVVLPAPDTTLEEAKKLFVGEGLIPG